MEIKFYKYQGTGNDFVIIDNRNGQYDHLTTQQVAHLCDRKFGIGGDGLMLLCTKEHYDFEMRYYNSDGRTSTMCGNGGRCMVKFASDCGIVKTTYNFLAVDGPHEAGINEDGTISLKMQDVTGIRQLHGDYVLNTGSPHYIHIADNVMDLDVVKKGRDIRYNKEFEHEGINVNFVEQTAHEDTIIVRTYERGVEDETLSCGTGVTAAALICPHNENGFNDVKVKTRGGWLSVEYEKKGDSFEDIWLIGPAVRVFEGIIHLD